MGLDHHARQDIDLPQHQFNHIRHLPPLSTVLRPVRPRRHIRSRQTNSLAPSPSTLHPRCVQCLLSTPIHGRREHELRDGRRLEPRKQHHGFPIPRNEGELEVRVWIRVKFSIEIKVFLARAQETDRHDIESWESGWNGTVVVERTSLSR